jgi:hypothetical protein
MIGGGNAGSVSGWWHREHGEHRHPRSCYDNRDTGRADGQRKQKALSSAYLIAVMVPTVLVLMATHTLEVMVWSFVYFIVEATPTGADRVYICLRQLHHAGIWGHRSGHPVAIVRSYDGHEWRAAVWLVDSGHI